MKTRFLYPFSNSFLDYPDNKSLSLTLYYTGCWGCCDDCQNKELQDPNYSIGTFMFTLDEIISKIKNECERLHDNKITLLGGDPLYPTNINFTKELLKVLHNEYDICVYTGQSIDFVKKNNINYFKYLKCGWYDKNKGVLSEKTDEYFQLASTNQELYNSEFNLLSKNGRYYF